MSTQSEFQERGAALVALMRECGVRETIVDAAQDFVERTAEPDIGALDELASTADLKDFWQALASVGFVRAEISRRDAKRFRSAFLRRQRAGSSSPDPLPLEADQAAQAPSVVDAAAGSASGAAQENTSRDDAARIASSNSRPTLAPSPALETDLPPKTPSVMFDTDRELLLKARELDLPGAESATQLTAELRDKLRQAAVSRLRKFLDKGRLSDQARALAESFHGKALVDLAVTAPALTAREIPFCVRNILLSTKDMASSEFPARLRMLSSRADDIDAYIRDIEKAGLVLQVDISSDSSLAKYFDTSRLRAWQSEVNERRVPLLATLKSIKVIALDTTLRSGQTLISSPQGLSVDDKGLQIQPLLTLVAHLQARLAAKINEIQSAIRDATGLRSQLEQALGIEPTGHLRSGDSRGRIISHAERDLLAKCAQQEALLEATRKAVISKSTVKATRDKRKPNKQRKSEFKQRNRPQPHQQRSSLPPQARERDSENREGKQEAEASRPHSPGPKNANFRSHGQQHRRQ